MADLEEKALTPEEKDKERRETRFAARLRSGSDFCRKVHKRWLADQDIYGGKHWSEDDITKLQSEDRAPIVLNVLRKTVDAVSGSEIINKFEPKFLPRTAPSDNAVSERLSEAVRFLRQTSGASYEESVSYRDAVACGIGAVEFVHDFSKGPNGRTEARWLPITEMVWDPSARRINLRDRKWQIRATWMSEWDFKKMFPDSGLDWGELLEDAHLDDRLRNLPMWPTPHVDEPHDGSRRHLYEKELAPSYDPRAGEILVYEEQCYETKYSYQVVNSETAELEEYTEDEWAILRRTAKETGEPEPVNFAVPRDTYYRSFFVGNKEIERKEIPSEFTVKFMTGFRHYSAQGVVLDGLIHAGKDAQFLTDKMLSQLVYIMSTNPKGTIVGPKSMFVNYDQAMEDWAKPNSFVPLQDDADLSRMQIVQGKYPDSYERVFEIAVSMVPQVTGIPPYFSGDVEDLRRTSGSAVAQVTQATDRVLAVLQDSLQLYREEAGRLYLDNMKAYMTDEEILRVSDDQGVPQSVPFDPSWVRDTEYDVVVTDAPKSQNQMWEFWSSLMQTDAFGLMVQLGIFTPSIIAKIIPGVPESVREEMKQSIAKVQQQQAMAAQQKQLTEGEEAQPEGEQ